MSGLDVLTAQLLVIIASALAGGIAQRFTEPVMIKPGKLACAVVSPAVRVGVPVAAGQAGPDVLLFVTTGVNTSQKRLLRFRTAFQKVKPGSHSSS